MDTSSSTLAGGGQIPTVAFMVLASNDWNCGTASTTNYLNQPTEDQIEWYDAGFLLKDYVGATTDRTVFSGATTTFSWNINDTGLKRTYSFIDVNAKCMELELQASSTAIRVNVMTK